MSDLNDIFIRAGQVLYGSSWQTSVAKALEMSDRHIRRIASGESNARPGMLIDLWRLMLERQVEMDKIIDEIKVHAATQDLPDRPDEDP